MGKLGVLPNIKGLGQVRAISPSIFESMRLCKLYGAFISLKLLPLLPQSPRRHIGTIIHKAIEAASYGKITTETEFEAEWENLASAFDKEMSANWLERNFVPIKNNVPSYEISKLKCWAFIRHKILPHIKGFQQLPSLTGLSPGVMGIEKFLKSKDSLIAGRVDAFFSIDGKIQIIDYKSGDIFEDYGEIEVKKAYATQMKIYAALFFENYNKWPDELLIIDLNGNQINVNFSQEECKRLTVELSSFAQEINHVLADADTPFGKILERLASPNLKSCMWCTWRPLCQPYWDATPGPGMGGWPADARGVLLERRQMENGMILAKIKGENCPQGICTIRGLNPLRHPALTEQKGEFLFFSLVPDKVEGRFREGSFTAVYYAG